MKIHQYERLWLIGSMILIVGFIVTITYGTVGLGITMIGDQEEALPPDDIDDDERFADPRVEQVGEDEYEAYVVAMTFIFQPDPIEVPADSEVTFYLTSRDVIHSFTVVGTNTNTMVIPGEVSAMTVEFDEPGEYGVVCNEYCGSGHHDMEGLLVVHPEDEFTLTELSADAPESVDPDEAIELEATIDNGLLDDLDATLEAEVGDETFAEDVTVPGDGSETVTITVDGEELGEGEHDWTVSVDDETESGSVTVGDEEDGGDDS
ncbi:cytochrome c oxidase subunit II [Natrialbaceae archaeon A-arb3/5]